MSRITARSQSGVVLMTSLIMLVMMTLLVVSLLRTSVIELKIGGANQITAQNLANADASLQTCINLNAPLGTFCHECVVDVDLSDDYDFSDPRFKHLANVTLTADELRCVEDAGLGTGNMLGKKAPDAAHFDLRADARDPVFSGRSIVHDGMKSRLPPGSCP